MTQIPDTPKVLHLVAGSGVDASARCLAAFKKGDAVLFIGDGVMQVLDPQQEFRAFFSSCYFLRVDLEARGGLQTAIDQGLQTVSDRKFVALLKQFDHCLTWK